MDGQSLQSKNQEAMKRMNDPISTAFGKSEYIPNSF
jgi:hypothetical protein